MIKIKIFIESFLFVIILLFTGVIDKGYEFSDKEFVLTYPTTKFYFTKSETPDSRSEFSEVQKINQQNYDRILRIENKLGSFTNVFPLILVQLFVSILFVKPIKPYKSKYYIIDFLLFGGSLLLLIPLMYYVLNISSYYILLILLLNYILSFRIRNYLIGKLN
ncbi:hypothetical protein F3J23_14520 [Chryseobacterium sp. Tr-659]|uniref:hypothetical protein n=1 Tax=Chryseobacterium sp. Tr-659 TaxID=2608340 RepID=UPI0014245A75|nr:hypothetical protein [Chryseobacterium sp. Tr-659]NIF06661.1 hypothetical protein [Chryseobacterium sp. Tr-659]